MLHGRFERHDGHERNSIPHRFVVFFCFRQSLNVSWCDKYNTKFDYVVHALRASPVHLSLSLFLSPGKCVWSHIASTAHGGIEYVRYVYVLNRWLSYCFYTFSIGRWCATCVFVAIDRWRLRLRHMPGRTTECKKVTYIRFRFFFLITYRIEVFVGRSFVSSCRCANVAIQLHIHGPCDPCLTTFIIGKILCVLQTTHHIRHVRVSPRDKYAEFCAIFFFLLPPHI